MCSWLRVLIISILFSGLFSSACDANIILDKTRVIYVEKQPAAKLVLKNSGPRNYLIQAWLDSGQNKLNVPFVVTPPIFKMMANGENVIQILQMDHNLPTDRESLFWLNVKAIPSMTDAESTAENKVALAVTNRIKFFYRPYGLRGEPTAAISQLVWSRSAENTLIGTNNSPYYVILDKIQINQENIPVSVVENNTVIPPHSHTSWQLRQHLLTVNHLRWSGLNDYGEPTPLYDRSL